MPLQGWAHEFYWDLSDTAVAPVVIGRGGYPVWQASVIAPSLLGTVGAWLDVRLTQFSWWWRFCRRVAKIGPRRRDALLYTLATLESPTYRVAQTAVRQAATTLGFAEPSAWLQYWRPLKANPGRNENIFRHIHACELLRQHVTSTLTNPEADFFVQLAYQQYAIEPWGDSGPRA